MPLLTSAFMQEVCERNRIPRREITAEALDLLCAYHWPGNVRELKNVVESLCVMTPTRTIDVPDLPAYFTRPGSPPAMAGEGAVSEPASTWNLAALERRAIQGALLAAGGNRREAAVLLGISQRTLYRKLAGIMPPDGAPPAGPGASGAAPRRARFPRRSGS